MDVAQVDNFLNLLGSGCLVGGCCVGESEQMGN